MRKLLGRSGIEDALKRLDSLTMEEARMAIAETLKVTSRVESKVTGGHNTFFLRPHIIPENGYH